MRGSDSLYLSLGEIEKAMTPISGARFILKHRPLRELTTIETEVLGLLGACYDTLALIDRMRIARENDLVKQIKKAA